MLELLFEYTYTQPPFYNPTPWNNTLVGSSRCDYNPIELWEETSDRDLLLSGLIAEVNL